MLELIRMAAKIALPTSDNDARDFWLGCIGIRNDGAMIFSKNGAVFSTDIENYHFIPEAHAECRAVKKMDSGGILYVARVRKKNKDLALAAPCMMCQIKIKARGISKVYFSINENQYGIWLVKKDSFRTFDC